MNRPQTRRPFIVVEGPDCAGKTTLIRGLLKRYIDAGLPAIASAVPAGTELGAKIREGIVTSKEKASLEAQLLAFCAGHAEAVEKHLLPNEATNLVIFDRYILSTIIYQGVSQNIPILPFLKRVDELVGHLPQPDMYIVLQATGEALAARKEGREKPKGRAPKKKVAKAADNMEGDGSIQHFQRMALDWAKPRLWVTGGMMTVDVSERSADEVLDYVWEELKKAFGDPEAKPADETLDAAREAASKF